MAETNPQNVVTNPRVKQYYDYAQQTVDEQAILDKFNAATLAQYNAQREQNRQAENNFYNQMYNTQKTAMDTIRQSNAAAVSSGASRGVQAANELSALLGLEQESVASATELAQASRQTAQEETAAVLENVLNASQQAQQERSQLVQQAIEADSLGAQESQAQTDRLSMLTSAIENGTASYLNVLNSLGVNYSTPSAEGYTSLQAALKALPAGIAGKDSTEIFNADTWAWDATGEAKAQEVLNNYHNICAMYGIDEAPLQTLYKDFKNYASSDASKHGKITKSEAATTANAYVSTINSYIQNAYAARLNNTTALVPNAPKGTRNSNDRKMSGIDQYFAR